MCHRADVLRHVETRQKARCMTENGCAEDLGSRGHSEKGIGAGFRRENRPPPAWARPSAAVGLAKVQGVQENRPI
jgi:hypothetical protein